VLPLFGNQKFGGGGRALFGAYGGAGQLIPGVLCNESESIVILYLEEVVIIILSVQGHGTMSDKIIYN